MKLLHPRSFISIVTLSSGLLLGGITQASLASTQVSAPLTSKEIIDNYRNLRASCAKMQGLSRRNCYSRLNDATADYQQAKERMSLTDPGGALLTSR
jgi:hypothetical protein